MENTEKKTRKGIGSNLFSSLGDDEIEIVTKIPKKKEKTQEVYEDENIESITRSIEITGGIQQNEDGSFIIDNSIYNEEEQTELDQDTAENNPKRFFIKIPVVTVSEDYERKQKIIKYDIYKLLKKSSNYMDFTVDELAAISYLSPEIAPHLTPQLFYEGKQLGIHRIFTYDLAWKLYDYFNVKILIDEKGGAKLTLLPVIEGFLQENHINDEDLKAWLKNKNKIYDTFKYNYKVGQKNQKKLLIQGGSIGMYNPTFTIFVAKNNTDMKDNVILETPVVTTLSETINYRKLSPEKLRELQINKPLLRSIVRKQENLEAGELD